MFHNKYFDLQQESGGMYSLQRKHPNSWCKQPLMYKFSSSSFPPTHLPFRKTNGVARPFVIISTILRISSPLNIVFKLCAVYSTLSFRTS